jgi:hypothetical protein
LIQVSGSPTINIAANGIRHRENKILFVDDFVWNHTVAAAGINYEKLLRLSLLVSDSRGRSCLWVGTLSIVLWNGAWKSRVRGSMEWRGVSYAVRFNGHQPKHLIAGPSASADCGLRRELQRAGHPLHRNVLDEGAQVGEIEQFTKVEQLLLDAHKKSDARKLASDSELPGCLSEQHYRLGRGFLFGRSTRLGWAGPGSAGLSD